MILCRLYLDLRGSSDEVDFSRIGFRDELASRTGIRLTGGRERFLFVAPGRLERSLLDLPPGIAAFAIKRLLRERPMHDRPWRSVQRSFRALSRNRLPTQRPRARFGLNFVTGAGSASHLLHRGRMLEAITLSWNMIGIAVLAVAAIGTRSVALAGFGLDSLIEIGASIVVLWELSGAGEERQRRALRLIGGAFLALAVYLATQSTLVLAADFHPRHSPLGIAWTAITAIVMFLLAAGKARTGRALKNPVLQTEGRVTTIDGVLAVAVLSGLLLNSALGWWWADPTAAYVLVYYASRESYEIFRGHSPNGAPS